MKKLFALAIVASMSFFSCGNTQEPEAVEGEAIEQTNEQQEQPAADMPEEVQEDAPAAE